MPDIKPEVLSEKFKSGDENFFYSKAAEITNFLLIKTFSVYDENDRQDMVQECMLNLFKKVKQGKVDPSKNLFSFIWTNSRFRILEIIRKESNRRRIAPMVSYDNIASNIAFQAEFENLGVGLKYAPMLQGES